MKYEITKGGGVDYAPESETAEIIQNVRAVLNTRIGTVPLHRDFGISWDHLDKPLPVAMSIQKGVIVDAVAKFEPRAKVEKVTFDGDGAEGILRPRVIISIGGE